MFVIVSSIRESDGILRAIKRRPLDVSEKVCTFLGLKLDKGSSSSSDRNGNSGFSYAASSIRLNLPVTLILTMTVCKSPEMLHLRSPWSQYPSP